MVELVDTLDLGSSSSEWGFESLLAHQTHTDIGKMIAMVMFIKDLMLRFFEADNRAVYDVSRHRMFTTRYEDLCM